MPTKETRLGFNVLFKGQNLQQDYSSPVNTLQIYLWKDSAPLVTNDAEVGFPQANFFPLCHDFPKVRNGILHMEAICVKGQEICNFEHSSN